MATAVNLTSAGRHDRIALFVPSLRGGGAERVMLGLAHGLVDAGHAVDMVLPAVEGPYLAALRSDVRVVDLRSGRVLQSLPALVRYLRRERPAALLATLSHANMVALWARRMAGVPTRIVLREANTLSVAARSGKRVSERVMPWLARRYYRWADEVVAVSDGVATDLVEAIGIPRARVHVLHNPLVTPELVTQAAEPLDHPWFADGSTPVMLGVGRLTAQKDFGTLIRAAARVRARRPVRLVILGEGGDRPMLEALVRELGLTDDVLMPGFADNPFKYMARAAVCVLSSAFEGSPGVLIQAMASGAPVVATDCPSGPREILDGGRWGRLVPVGDVSAMAKAIEETLDEPRRQLPPTVLARFTAEAAVDGYLRLLRGAADA